MAVEETNDDTNGDTVNEAVTHYEKAGLDLLREGLQRNYTERFLFATQLYKTAQMLNRATIIHRPDTLTE